MGVCQVCGPQGDCTFNLRENNVQLRCLCLCDKCLRARAEKWDLPVYQLDVLRNCFKYEKILLNTLQEEEDIKRAKERMKKNVKHLVKKSVAFGSHRQKHADFLEIYKEGWYKSLGLQVPTGKKMTLMNK